MALALCAQLAHLSVLKLSSELHGGGPGRVQTLEKPARCAAIGQNST